ncbi:tRNA 4-thiouridine(8) synthase ThiI [Candidatus Parcubacteria bacterium]|nr:tRNA 4-thiouridine(8) synthase ThiI [Candidatus Parcubacteria bacterium]
MYTHIYNHIIIHYDEITLKGGNRPFFERVLISNIKEFLENIKYDKIYKDGGKIIIEINKNTDLEKTKEVLENIPGISNFYFAVSEKKDLEKINKKTVEFLRLYIKENEKTILRQAQDDDNVMVSLSNHQNGKIKTFKIEARRSDKKFEFKSPEINARVGESVLENTELKVNVHNPDIEIVVDIGHKYCYIYFEKIKGIGGLPVGTAGKLVSLLSGGIDSPVASYMMMKRGAKIVFVHFKNKIINNTGDDKIKSLVKKLSRFQGRSKLYIIPFEEFQKEIIAKIPAKNRMIIYRRIMFELAEMIAKKEKAKGFVTGDSLSQVASQTLDNIGVIYNSANLPIFPPLIGMNKQEIIDLAVKIKTYEISILPYQDCCSFLIAKHPETKAKLRDIIKQEENLKIDEIAERIMAEIKPEVI